MSRLTRAFAVVGVACLCACAGPGARPHGAPIENRVHRAPRVPDTAERAAAALAAAALASHFEAGETALAKLQNFDAERAEGPTGLEPAALNLQLASLERAHRHRNAIDALLARKDLDPALRRRLEYERNTDPLVHANARVADARRIQFARAFNTIAEPVGRSLTTTALAPIRLSQALVRYGLDLYRRDPLPLQRRQALAHWKEFIARYPDAPERERISEQIEEAQVRWHQTQRKKALAQASRALAGGRARDALVFADRALRHSPENANAERVRSAAAEQLEYERQALASSIRYAGPAPTQTEAETARAWLTSQFDPSFLATTSSAQFAALPHLSESDAEARLEALASGDVVADPIVRHARAAHADPVRNPHEIFRAARARDRKRIALWILLGPLLERDAPTTLDTALETLVEFPSVFQAGLSLPLRILQWPWMPPPASAKATAVQARRYLARYPEGIHKEDVLDWIERYETARNNAVGALRIAEQRNPGGTHDALREDAARQALRVAIAEQRLDVRHAMLTGVTRRFPKTEAGDEAGRLARSEAENYSPHRIVISRGFLEENPEVAGPAGLDLAPSLLDDNPSNGELHPDGVALLGRRVLELSYVPESGNPRDDADTDTIAISADRLAHFVARLEETSFRNALLDAEDPVIPNAHRDLVFERARLGLAETEDNRPTAHADFVYRSMRERYGVVRRREPILPFDLIVQGSLSDLSLGAFPRLREPDATPDAVLYE